MAAADGEARREEVAGRQEEAAKDGRLAKLNVDELSAQFAKHTGSTRRSTARSS